MKKQLSNELALNTGSNFFNVSEDQLNQPPIQIDDKSAKFDAIIQDTQSNGSNFLTVPASDQNQLLPIEPKTRGISRFGNHRNKTSKGFQRANISIALKQKEQENNRFNNGKRVSQFPSQKYFQSFSPGIFLFFAFLKRMVLLFCLLTLIYIIPLIYNLINGNAFSYKSTNIQSTIALTMLGNQSANSEWSQTIKDKLLIVFPDTISSVIFYLFVLYWSIFSDKMTHKLKQSFKQASDTTIQVTKFGSQLTQQDIQQYFNKYGPIREIAAVKNYERMIDLSKQTYELSLKIKEKMITNIQNKQKLDQQYLDQKQNKMNKLLQTLDIIQRKRQKKKIKFYIRFQQQQSKLKVLEDFNPYYSFFSCCVKNPPQDLKIKGKFPRIRACQTEPSQIIWENMHITIKSRWLRFLLQCILIIAIIILGFIFISFLNISTPPTTYKNIQTDQLTFEYVKQLNDSQISYSWCISKDSSSFTAQEQSFCQTYTDNYKLRILLSVGITIVIIIFKFILKQIMIRIAHFQRYKHHTQLSTNIMTNLFIIYISTTVMITFLLQANIFGISFKKFMQIFVKNQQLLDNIDSLQEYTDFQQYWYKDIGYQIWMNWLILSLFPYIFMPIYHFLRQKIFFNLGKKEILQKNVKSWIQSEQFQIQDNYADILMLVFVGFGFAGGIPFLVPLTLVGLITRMIYVKYVFVRFCKIPKYYNEVMNERIKLILQIMLIFHMGISIWMYGVSQIFTNFQKFQIFQEVANYSNWLAIIGIKLASNWYLSIILIAFIIGFVFFRIILKLIKKICAKQNKSSQQNAQKIQSVFKQTNSLQSQANRRLKITQITLTDSYKIQKNPNYFQILAIMKPQQAQSFLHQTMGVPFFNLRKSRQQIPHN